MTTPKNHFVEQIREWNERAGKIGRGSTASFDLSKLARMWEKNDNKADVSDFFVIRLVTIIELFVRTTIRSLISRDPLYLKRSENLLKSVRIDFEIIYNLHGKNIEVGDIVAHAISLNRLSDIIASLNALIPGYREALPSAREQWLEDDGPPRDPIIHDVNIVLSSIDKLLSARHIIVHELPQNSPYEIDDVYLFISSAAKFIEATEWIISNLLDGVMPRTQIGMNAAAGDELAKADSEMEAVLESLRSADHIELDLLEKSQEAWSAFASAEADLEASAVAGGSMYPLLWSSKRAELTRERTVALKERLDQMDSAGEL